MRKNAAILLFLIISFAVKADIILSPIFGDNMVLQQNRNVKIWGWTDEDSVIIKPSWTNESYTVFPTGEKGLWDAMIATPSGSYETYQISLSTKKQTIKLQNIAIGEVWVCSGQSNMEMPMKGFKNQPVENSNIDILKSRNENIRLITVKRSSSLIPKNSFTGEWNESSPVVVKDFSATAYYFGKLLQEVLDVPIGLVNVSWGGSWVESWMSKEMLSDFDRVVIPNSESDIKVPNRTPTTLFNGMINPILGYTIQGCIWYQGESNYDRAADYPSLFAKMVSGWRELWNQGDFPFYYCQIAPYNNPPEKHGDFNGSFLREAQAKSLDLIPNSGMAVLMDIGEENCIHPRNKKVGAERLALLALGKTYKKEGFAFESPSLKEAIIEGDIITLSFNNAPMWMTSFGKEISLFEVAGADKKFYPAKATIKRSKIEVTCPKVKKPVAVRYAFKDYVKGELFGTEGLPISCFRTDDWNE